MRSKINWKNFRGLIALNNDYIVSVTDHPVLFCGVVATCYYPNGDEFESVIINDSKISDYVDCWVNLPINKVYNICTETDFYKNVSECEYVDVMHKIYETALENNKSLHVRVVKKSYEECFDADIREFFG